MFDLMLCFGFVTHMVRVGYFALVTDLLRQAWATCRGLGVAAARLHSRNGAPILRDAGEIILRRPVRLETRVTSMT